MINSYEQYEYVGIRDCSLTSIAYLLYSTRPKIQGHNYSVQIDVYENHRRFSHRASWLFPLSFPFLPVHRVAVKLEIPPSDFISWKVSHCKRYCLHGSCTGYINNYGDFCRCHLGWSGPHCSIRHNCNCSPNATCIGSINNRSICVCPLYTYEPRCYLKRSSCLPNPCQNDGFCTPADERIMERTFSCMCSEEFSGDQCEIRNIRLDVTFSKDIQVPSFLHAYFVIRGNGIDLDHITTFAKLSVFEINVILYVPLGARMVLTNFNHQFYLTATFPLILNPVNISSHITSAHRCQHIRELFNATFVELHHLRRLKKYHLPCQKQSKLMCFHDDT